jgi:inorganic pyrophosphatase
MEPITIFILVAGLCGLAFAGFLFLRVRAVSTQLEVGFGDSAGERKNEHTVELIDKSGHQKKTTTEINKTLLEIYEAVRLGADSFLMAEYRICLIFIAFFEIIVIVLVAHVGVGDPDANAGGFDWSRGAYSGLSFGVGALCSIFTGYLSMKVAVFSNVRTAVSASQEGAAGWRGAFSTAMNAGGVTGFLLCSTALLVLFFMCSMYAYRYGTDTVQNCKRLFESIAGFGLGGSSIAMFGRVGGGIFTKAADVGSDLAGKVVAGIPEDDPRNPGVIADNVGDNVGDVAGMGSDLFGSFAEASCAALIVGATSYDLVQAGWGALMFPLAISATGIFCGIVTHFFATDIWPVKSENDVLRALKVQLGVSTILVTASLWPIISYFLPAVFIVDGDPNKGTTAHVFFAIAVGLWGGCLIGFVTEYFTSYDYRPTQEVAESTETGAATNIIYGIALGYKSAVIPILILATDVYVSFSLLGMYGVGLCALGMLCTLSSCLTIDVYGPICDNGGGFAEMAEMHPRTREKTDALDAAGNTTAAIGKGFAIGSAALVSLALLGAFVTRVSFFSPKIQPFCNGSVSLLQPITFAMLIIGGMIPYWFSAMTMKSVGKAAMDMVKEVARQFREIPGLLEGTPGHGEPQHGECIRIATEASLKEMILPGALVILSPLIVGSLFGVNALVGFLSGSLCSGVQIAVSMSNTGGAWDNAKKYVEKGMLKFKVPGTDPVEYKVQTKGSDAHKAAVVGDTVGDPFKDTSGPAINIVMKLMAILSLVFADFFMSLNDGRGAFDVWIHC